MYYLDKNKVLTNEMINRYIEDYKVKHLTRLLKNKRYYDGKNDGITNRHFKDRTKPNNKYATGWSKYITTLIGGYFMGKPVSYSTEQDVLQAVISANSAKEIHHNQALENDCSIYGLACELLWVDENKNIKFNKISPCGVIPIYSTSIDKELLYVIRFWDTVDIVTGDKCEVVELYDKTSIRHYKLDKGALTPTITESHMFNDVPINIYYNNEGMTGDAEGVQSLIDAYDLALSDTANYRAELNDSYLVFQNTDLATEDIVAMKEKRIIQIEDSGEGMASSVSWLNKDSNDTENENFKTRLSEDIKRFSFIGDIETTKSHTTATSAKIGLLGIEQVCSAKESCFREALIRRLKLISNVLSIRGLSVNTDDVNVTFIRNIPIDLSVIADTIVKLAPFVPKQILLEQIPFVIDAKKALEMKQEEDKLDNYGENIFKGDDDE